jgi:dTDP-glucose 4,6-dehydratase
VNRALGEISRYGKAGESYHISTNDLVTIFDLVEIIARKLNIKLNDLVDIAPDRPGKDFAYQLNSQKIRTELSWRDSISLSDGIDRTINWAKENLEELRKMPLDYIHRK